MLPPMAEGTAGGTQGNVAGVALAVSVTAATIDLSTMIGQPVSALSGAAAQSDPSPIGAYLSMQAQAGDVYFIFGSNLASVTGSNAPNPATNNTLTANKPNSIPAICFMLPSGTRLDFKLPLGSGGPFAGTSSPCRFLSYVTLAGTATLRMWQSSPR
jgi:hypothetical protein